MRDQKEQMTANLGQNKVVGFVENMLKQTAEQARVNELWQDYKAASFERF